MSCNTPSVVVLNVVVLNVVAPKLSILYVTSDTMVENSTHNHKIESSNPATASAKQKVMKKSFSCYKTFMTPLGAPLETLLALNFQPSLIFAT